MYEEKTRKLNINWKSLIIKMAILLVAIFIILWIISLVNKDNKKPESNLNTNLDLMKSAALEYFTEDKLPKAINGTKKITLEEMLDSKLVSEFTDQNGDKCHMTDSYIMATKINSDDYTIKVKLVCSEESDYVINTITLNDEVDDTQIEEESATNNEEENIEENSSVTNTKPNNSSNNNTSATNKNNNSQSSNKNQSNTSNNKTTSTNTNINKVTTTNKTNKTCTYGDLSYTAIYPLAYKVSGDCAVSKDVLYSATHSNKVSKIGAVEYKKLLNEMSKIEANTGRDLNVLAPQYKAVLNKKGTGYVGYQILFKVEEKNAYYIKEVYTYYLDSKGNRKVVIDKRNSLTNTNNTVLVKSISLNKTSLSLKETDTYTLIATINPVNATNKNITWKSGNTSVATVSNSGKVTAKKAGVSVITASAGGKSVSATVTVIKNDTYKYCKSVTETHYSTSYTSNKSVHSHEWDIIFKNKNMTDVKISNTNYITTTAMYKNAYNYFKNKTITSGNINTKYIVSPTSYTDLSKHSLTNGNFKYILEGPYKKNGEWIVTASYQLYNVNNVSPYYASNINKSIYFVPFYFEITYKDLNNCVNITDEEAKNYPSYSKVK